MTSWAHLEVTAAPEIALVNWAVFEIPSAGEPKQSTRHFVGLTAELRNVRVSSPVVVFDPAHRLGLTRSGRCYELRGHSGIDADSRYVWARWRVMNHILQEWDISSDVEGEIREAGG